MKKNNIIIAFTLSCVSIVSHAIVLDNKNIKKSMIEIESESIANEFIELKKDYKLKSKDDLVKKAKVLIWGDGLDYDNVFDTQFEDALKKFQENNDLKPTGVLDNKTWFKLYKQPKEWRLEQIQKSINNWDEIKSKIYNQKDTLAIVVNIPNQKLYLIKNDNNELKEIMTSSVIVGKITTQTPMDSFDVIGIKYNPTWTPTNNILKRNILKNGKIDYKWIDSHNLSVYDKEGNKVNSTDVTNLKDFRFIQSASNSNALGVLKFETNSSENIYLHDTNERKKFSYNTRLYSSGCVRVENYLELASKISNQEENIILEKIKKDKTFFEKLSFKIPVYFDYSLVGESNNSIEFYPDVYKIN